MADKKATNQFFDEEVRGVSVRSKKLISKAANDLERDVKQQIKRNFKNASSAFERGVKVSHFDNASYVRLSPILSAYAQSEKISGNPNVWILLPDGVRLGFKRISKAFNWTTIKQRYGRKLSFVPVSNGHVLLFRSRRGTFPIYKIQKQVQSKQRVKFFESAERIANKNNFEVF